MLGCGGIWFLILLFSTLVLQRLSWVRLSDTVKAQDIKMLSLHLVSPQCTPKILISGWNVAFALNLLGRSFSVNITVTSHGFAVLWTGCERLQQGTAIALLLKEKVDFDISYCSFQGFFMPPPDLEVYQYFSGWFSHKIGWGACLFHCCL